MTTTMHNDFPLSAFGNMVTQLKYLKSMTYGEFLGK